MKYTRTKLVFIHSLFLLNKFACTVCTIHKYLTRHTKEYGGGRVMTCDMLISESVWISTLVKIEDMCL